MTQNMQAVPTIMPKTSQVSDEMDKLQGSLERLGDRVSLLVERVSRIRYASPETQSVPQTLEPSLCELADDIRKRRHMAEAILDMVIRTLDELEL